MYFKQNYVFLKDMFIFLSNTLEVSICLLHTHRHTQTHTHTHTHTHTQNLNADYKSSENGISYRDEHWNTLTFIGKYNFCKKGKNFS